MDKIIKIIKKDTLILIVIAVAVSLMAGLIGGIYGASLSKDSGNVIQTLSRIVPRATPTPLDIKQESEVVVSLVEKTLPGVVSIVATKDLPVYEQYFVNPFEGFCDDPFFGQFFGGCQQESYPQYRQKGTENRQVGAGTGFFVSSDGMIITNKHVVEDTEAQYTVMTSDGKKLKAKVLARDPYQDLAILKVDGFAFPALKLGNSETVKVGQTVIAIGNALGEFSNSVSKGIVSGLSRSITAGSRLGAERLDRLIQTDAAINPGNSGGPLINLDGQVIGINTAIVSGAQSVGFALPIDIAKRDMASIKTSGRIIYPYIGVRYQMIDKVMQEKNGLKVDYGALIIRGKDQTQLAVIPNGPAAKAGILEGDIILEINGKKIDSNNTLSDAIQQFKIGQSINLRVLRNDQYVNISVVLEEKK